MAYTKFGEFVRILRVHNHQVMGNMAKILDTSVPFLSAVENGKKNVPLDWVEKIANAYALNDKQREELVNAIEESKTQYKIITANAGALQRKTALKFARSFDGMDDETAEKIMALLCRKADK